MEPEAGNAGVPFPVLVVGSRGCCASGGIVVALLDLDQHSGVGKAVKDFAVEQIVTQGGVKALVISVLPR